jgi:xanthine dehydrogenase small subunit
MHNTVQFILAGQLEELHNCEPTRTVLEFLREDKGLKGTKEGCAEGDCGACTVVIGELHDEGIRYQAVNSCIQFLASLDGKQLVTVEDLSQADEQAATELHAVQQAMVDQHGSQCGFCTPGFVMSLFAMYHNERKHGVNRSEIELGIAGNLCRCTGYAPIIRAAEQVLKAGRTDHFTVNKDQHMELLKSIQPSESLEVSSATGRFFAPRTADELCKLLENHPEATMVAGATDVGLWVTKQNRRLETVIYLGAVAELKKLETGDKDLRIGAAVSYTDASQAITDHYPAFMPLIQRIGASQVRNAGTIGGNIANGSPIGDMPPGLIALGARLVLRDRQGRRLIDLEDYFISYGQQDLRGGEFVEQVRLPKPPKDQLFATYKVSKRLEQDISAVCAAFSMQVDNGIISQVRVCFGGMAETPRRAANCEQQLSGKPWSQETIDGAKLALLEDYTPITDMRASALYRMRVAQNLLQRFYLEHTSKPYPVRLESENEG